MKVKFLKFSIIFFFVIFPFRQWSQSYTWAMIDSTSVTTGFCLSLDRFDNLHVVKAYSIASMRKGIAIEKYDLSHQKKWEFILEGNFIYSRTLTNDSDGNVYFVGSFGDTLILNGDTLISACNSCPDLIAIKLDANGNLKWFKRSVGVLPGVVKVDAIDCDSKNYIYIYGRFSDYLKLDTVVFTAPSGQPKTFIAKFNTNGDLIWIRLITGGFGGMGKPGLKTDSLGNCYVAGSFISHAEFGSIALNSFDDYDIYLAKIDSTGKWVWAKKAGGYGQDVLFGLDLDKQGNTFLTGFTSSSVVYFNNITLTNIIEDDYYLCKYDSTGEAIWAIKQGGAGSQIGYDILVDNLGLIYLRASNAFLSKFSNTGQYLGSDFKNANNYSMVLSNDNCVYITGNTNQSVNFDGITLTPHAYQMYIAKYCDNSLTMSKDETILPVQSSILVYPNPTDGLFSIRSTVELNCEIRINVKDMLGRSILIKMFNNSLELNSSNIDLRFAAPGIYFVEMENSENSTNQVKKIVIQ